MTDATPAPRTHRSIDRRLCGEPIELQPGRARVLWRALPEMAADERGLVHGGFVFGLADYAAMLAVDHPHVVLGGADVRFLKPCVVGDVLVATARIESEDGRKRRVGVEAHRGDELMMSGSFLCVVPDRHVLG